MENGSALQLVKNAKFYFGTVEKFFTLLHGSQPKITENQVSYDHRSYERNLSNCVQKPEKVRTSTGFEPVTSRYRCDALTNLN